MRLKNIESGFIMLLLSAVFLSGRVLPGRAESAAPGPAPGEEDAGLMLEAPGPGGEEYAAEWEDALAEALRLLADEPEFTVGGTGTAAEAGPGPPPGLPETGRERERAGPESRRAVFLSGEGEGEPVLSSGTIILDFRDASLDAVLEYLSEVAGLIVIRETPVEGRVTVMSRQPISVDEAVGLLSTILRERGHAALLDGRTLHIVPLAEAKRRNIPVLSGRDPAALEPGDRIVTQVVPLRFVNAVQLRQDLSPLMPPYAELAANAASNSLIITGTQSDIRRTLEIINAVDSAVSVVAEIRVFPLLYAGAANLAGLVNELFREEQQAAGRQQQAATDRMARFIAARAGGTAQQPPAAEEGPRLPRVNALADERTNTLVVSGPAEALAVVEVLVGELDNRPEEEQAVFVYSLRNAKAGNLQTILNNLFREMGTQGSAGTARTTTGAARPAADTTRTATGAARTTR